MKIGSLAHCHICGDHADTVMEKCKLDCDGLEQEFCPTCANLYREFKFGSSEQAFDDLRARRLQFIESTKPPVSSCL